MLDDDDNFLCLGREKNVPFADRVAFQNSRHDKDLMDEKKILLIHIVTQEVLFKD